jgi:hypothetical protein
MNPSNPGREMSQTSNRHGPKSLPPRINRFDCRALAPLCDRARLANSLLRTDAGAPDPPQGDLPRSVSASVTGSPRHLCESVEKGTIVPLQVADEPRSDRRTNVIAWLDSRARVGMTSIDRSPGNLAQGRRTGNPDEDIQPRNDIGEHLGSDSYARYFEHRCLEKAVDPLKLG